VAEGLALLQANKRVMELGAGQGLPGLLAHHLGAAHVTLTDFVPQLVETLADSARVAMAQSSRDGGGGGDAEGERGRRVVSAAMLDWQAEARDVEAGVAVTEEDTFEVLLASDVVYAVEHAVRVYTLTSTCVMIALVLTLAFAADDCIADDTSSVVAAPRVTTSRNHPGVELDWCITSSCASLITFKPRAGRTE
jgi:hypothetical protein